MDGAIVVSLHPGWSSQEWSHRVMLSTFEGWVVHPCLRIPEDLSVIGFDDIEMAAYMGLTTVRQPLEPSGRLAAQRFLELLAGSPEVLEEKLEITLTARNTTPCVSMRKAPCGLAKPSASVDRWARLWSGSMEWKRFHREEGT